VSGHESILSEGFLLVGVGSAVGGACVGATSGGLKPGGGAHAERIHFKAMVL
jgi:hypothetical protein